MKLPHGWTIARLGDIVVERVEQGVPTTRPVPYIDIGCIDRETKLIGETEQVTASTAPTRARQWVRGGDVLVSMTRPNLNAVALVPEVLDGAIASTGFDVLRSAGVLPEWIYYRVRSHAFIQDICADVQGVVYPAIRPTDVRRHELPIPPGAEQRRIVDALESHLSRLDAAVASLERVQAKLKAYRASVLKAAVEGRLVPTEAVLARREGRSYEPADVLLQRILKERRRLWEGAELAKMKAAGKAPVDDRWKGKYQEPASPDASKLPSLPQGWCWTTLDQLSTLVRNGHSAPPRESAGVRTLRISALRPLTIDFEDVRYLPGRPEDFADDLVDVDDLLFTRYNGTPSLVGVCGRVRFLDRPTVHPDKLIKVRLVTPAASPFIEIAANAGNSRGHVESRTRTTAGQAGISGADLKQMPVPLPPQEEQERIGSTVETLLTVEATTRRDIDLALRRCAALRQALLKAALEGTLVDQRSDDEPADALLARIRAERAEATPAKPKQKRSRTLKAAS